MASHWQIWDSAYSVWLNDGPQRCPCPEPVHIWQKSVCRYDWVRWRSNPVFCLFVYRVWLYFYEITTKKNPVSEYIWLVADIHRGVSMCRKSCKHIPCCKLCFSSLTLFTFFFTVLYTVVYCCCWVAKSCLTLWGDPIDWSSPALLSVGFPRQKYWKELAISFSMSCAVQMGPV